MRSVFSCADALRKRMVGTAAAAVPAASPFKTERRPSFLCLRSLMRPPSGVVGRGTVVQPPLVAKRVAMILYTCPGRELVVELHRAMISEAAIRSLRQAVGERNCITEPEQLRTYECDGLTSFRLTPAVVVLPETTAEVVEVVKVARAHGLPLVPRGSGTGLSGGALPVPGW